MLAEIDEQMVRRMQRTSLFAVCLALFISIGAIAGWVLDIEFLRAPFVSSRPINPVTALCLLALSFAFILERRNPSSKITSVILWAVGLVILLSLTVRDALFRTDQILFFDSLAKSTAGQQGMALSTAMELLFPLASFWLVKTKKENNSLQQAVAFVSWFFCLVVLTLYVNRVPEIQSFRMMAPLTAFLVALLSVALMLANPDKGFMNEMSSSHYGGFVARYLAPIAIVAPIIIGYVRLFGHWYGLLSTELGVSILTLTVAVLFGSSAWLIARILNRRSILESKNTQLSQELTTANTELQATVEELQAANEELVATNEELNSLLDQLSEANHTIAQQKDEQLNRVLESTTDVIWSFDLTGARQNYLSRSAERVYQRPYEELITKPYFWIDQVHAEDRDVVIRNLHTLEKRGESECVYRLQIDGQTRWFRDKCRLIKNDNGSNERLEGIASDITDQKRQQEELEKSRLHLETIFSNSSDNFVLLNTQAELLFFNKGYQTFAQKFSGSIPLLGMNFFESLPADRVQKNKEAFDRALKGETVQTIGETTAMGKTHYFNIRYGPVIQHKTVTHVTLSAFEITHQKRQEKTLEQYKQNLEIIFNRTRDVFILLDANLNTLMFNKAALDMSLDISGMPLEIGASFLNSAPTLRREKVEQVLNKVLSGEAITVIPDFKSISGKDIHYKVSYEPVFNDGKVTHISIGGTDISELKKSDQALNDYRHHLEIIFNRTHDVFVLLDADLKVIMHNKKAHDLTREVSDQDMEVGHYYYEYAPPGRRDAIKQSLQRVLNDEVVSYAAEFTSAHGKSLHYWMTHQPVKEAGKVAYITIAAVDISEVRRQEKISATHRENLEIIFENTTDMFMLLDTSLNIVLLNKQFQQHLNQFCKKDAKPGINLLEVLPPAGRSDLENIMARAKNGERVRSFSESLLENKLRSFDVIYNPVIKEGIVTHISVTASDVTEKREQQAVVEEYRQNLDIVFKASKDTFLLVDANERVVLFNSAFAEFIEQLAGIIPAVGLTLQEVVSPARRQAAAGLFKKALRGESVSTEAEVVTARGEKIYHYVRYEPVVKDGKVTHVCISGVDLTAFRKIENELKEKQYFLDKASETAQIGYWTCDPDLLNGKITWSKQMFEIFEFEEAAFTGRASLFHSFVHPDDQTFVSESLEAGLANGFPRSFDHRILLKNGNVKWIHQHVDSLKDNGGNIVFVFGVAQDITERKKIENELKQDQYFLERASEAAEIGYWTSVPNSPDGALTWSEKVYKIFNLSKEDFDGTNKTFYRRVHPEDRRRVAEVTRLALENDSIYNIDHRIVSTDGTVRWVNERAQILRDNANHPTLLVGIVQDINDRKIIEEVLREYNDRFEILSKATNDAIWDWDIEKDSLQWNHGIESIFGYAEQDMKRTYEWWENKIHPEDHDRINSETQNAFENHFSNWTSEYRYQCKDGSYKYVLDRAYIIYRNNKPVRMIGAMQDVTEIMNYRLNLEQIIEDRTQKLNQALIKEKELVDLKSKFISIASHEFRTPLTTISLSAGFLKRFKSKVSAEQLDDKLGNIEKQVRHMTSLLDDVLFIGKTNEGKVVVTKKEFQPELLQALATEAFQSARHNDHILNYYTTGSVRPFYSDDKLLRNIIFNLVTNAVKFSPSGSKVTMNVNFEEHQLVLVVRDEGIGIPLDEQQNLFMSFSRATNAATIDGTGLGLLIIKKAVDLLNGTVSVWSEVGKGTEFTIALPIANT